MSRKTRLILTFLPGLLGVPFLLAYGPIAQEPSYHRFADQRFLLGIPHFGDVVSNLPFVLVGLAGITRPAVALDFKVFFLGIALTGIGSGYYHLDPNNQTLVWDRLPMTLAFMGFFVALIRERVSDPLGRRLLGPLVIVGAASVAVWVGTGDLRAYALVQFYPLLTAILMLLLLPGPSTSTYWLALGSYVAAKITELLDHQIYAMNGLVTGHNLKHLFAALGAYWIVRMLNKSELAATPGV